MKVCTDSCLFGAWTAHWLLNNNRVNHILDIGAGTGLLSLMLAQKNSIATIDAVEIDQPSTQQAKENFAQSSWRERLNVIQCSIQDFLPQKKYDFIISNPPFYQEHLLSKNERKNNAHHHTSLTLHQLIIAIKRLLSDEGSIAVLLPEHRTNEFEMLASEAGFFLHKKTWVTQTNQHRYFRSMNIFSKEKTSCYEDEMSIKDDKNNYTSDFSSLLNDYYLHL